MRPSDENVEKIVENVKEELEQKTGSKYESLKVVHYKTQLVSGINYFVKVSSRFASCLHSATFPLIMSPLFSLLTRSQAIAKTVDGIESTIHLRIYQDLKKRLELSAHRLDQPYEAELEYFQ